MYVDPAQIRKHRVTLYLNDAEANVVQAINEYIGGEKAPLLRDLLIASAHRVLAGEANLLPSSAQNEAPQLALFQGGR